MPHGNSTTRFHPLPGSPEGVAQAFARSEWPLVLVSRHGLGDNVFASPCFAPLRTLFDRLYFCSSVNAYASIFHDSALVQVIYAGGVNGCNLGLHSAAGFAEHFERLHLDLGASDAWVYHFGLFEPHLPYSDERAFVKGRRNMVEFFQTGPSALDTPRYHVAPDRLSRDYVHAVLDRWLQGRELLVIARYGHTDGGKNFGHDSTDTVDTARLLDQRFPDRFRYLSLDYLPGDHAADGRLSALRSVYGFLPCDTASMHHILSRATALVTVPTGSMLVGATIPGLRLITLWKTMSPFHFLDPQFDGEHPVHALVERPELASFAFADSWGPASRAAVLRRWRVTVGSITPASVVDMLVPLIGAA